MVLKLFDNRTLLKIMEDTQRVFMYEISTNIYQIRN